MPMTLAIDHRPPPPVTFHGDRLSVHFDRFDGAAYQRFLQLKRLPESAIEFHPETESYTISAPKRFAAVLGERIPDSDAGDLLLSEFLFDDQRAIVRMALDAKRFACWSDCGLGKSLITLEFARQVIHRTGPGTRFLIVTMNEIVEQFTEEARRFYGDSLPIRKIGTRQLMRDWCASAPGENETGPERLAIVNYEKFNPGKEDQTVNELRHLAGIACDESSRLKTGGGKQKWAIIKSTKGIEYKLSCTATPAPNDTMEFASQASFLERMRNESDIIWTYFQRDNKTRRWTVKRHARKAFFEFMASWSIYVRDPRKYGWRLDHPDIPAPVVQVHEIGMTDAQRAALQKFSADPMGQKTLFQSKDINTIQRAKLSQVAKGFVYHKGARAKDESGAKLKDGRDVKIIPSLKPAFVAELIAAEVKSGLQVLCWTVFDAESRMLADELRQRGVMFELLTGATPGWQRLQYLEAFRHGEARVLISRAAMLGYGMNFQCCGSMVFSGWNDSYESYYQAVRRAYRHGQTKSLRVHLPVIPELEGDMLETIFSKEEKHLAAIEEMERNYVKALGAMGALGA